MYARSAEWQRKLWERREAERLQRERKELQEVRTVASLPSLNFG